MTDPRYTNAMAQRWADLGYETVDPPEEAGDPDWADGLTDDPATLPEVEADHADHETVWAQIAAPGYGRSLYCYTCERSVWSNGGILTLDDVR